MNWKRIEGLTGRDVAAEAERARMLGEAADMMDNSVATDAAAGTQAPSAQ